MRKYRKKRYYNFDYLFERNSHGTSDVELAGFNES